MENFWILVIGAVLSVLAQTAYKEAVIPLYDRLVRRVPQMHGSTWTDNGRLMEIRQTGAFIKAEVIQKPVETGVSKFRCMGKIVGRDLILTWENPKSAVHGAMVLRLSRTCRS